MAQYDIKKYYYSALGQYVSLKEDMKDFEQGLKDGYITEERLAEIKEEFERVKENYTRVAYIMFLAELPNRKAKKAKYLKNNRSILEDFEAVRADEGSVIDENKSLTSDIKKKLKEILEESKHA